MTPRQLDVAHEFCERVSVDDLLDYLGLAADASADEARAALKARRRKMQGMQSNPKFRDEARLLIRNFQALDAVLGNPGAHVRDMATRRESTHLPILEMTIRGVLTGGSLSSEQEAYLRANAAELGVSNNSFDQLLRRLQVETHTERSKPGPTGETATPEARPPTKKPPSKEARSTMVPPVSKAITPEEESETLLADLGFEALQDPPGLDISDLDAIDLGAGTGGSSPRRRAMPRSGATSDTAPSRSGASGGGAVSTDGVGEEVRPPRNRAGEGVGEKVGRMRAKEGRRSGRKRKKDRATPLNPESDEDTLDRKPRGDFIVPSDGRSDPPSLTSAATAPPVRMRAIAPGTQDDPSTARRQGPPRSIDDGLPGGMEVVGPTHHEVEVQGRKGAEVRIRVRLLGELPVAARVIVDDTWLSVDPDRLSPTRREHVVIVTVHPDKMFKDEDQSTVRLFNDLGEQVEVTIAARRSVNWSALFIGISVVLGVIAIALAAWWLSTLFTPNTARSLVVNVYPTSEYILLDGEKIGIGQSALLERPLAGSHRLTVVQQNFEVYEDEISLVRDEQAVRTVRLKLSNSLGWSPSPGAKRGTLDVSSLRDLPQRLQGCVALTPQSFPNYNLEVRITVKDTGIAGDVSLVGRTGIPTPVANCLRDHGATLAVPPLANNADYAVVSVPISYPTPSQPARPVIAPPDDADGDQP